MVVEIEYVDFDEAYGFFGKVVAKSHVRGWSDAEIDNERQEMLHLLTGGASSLVVAREVEEVIL